MNESQGRGEKSFVLTQPLEAANAAWQQADMAAVRTHCARMTADADMPAHYRSYAHLRMAQSYLAEGNEPAARETLAAIEAEAGYPAVHRLEAGEVRGELERTAQGLPPRDPQTSRTQVRRIETFAAQVQVAPDGDDAGDGSAARPFATLQRAREAVRALKAQGVDGPLAVTVQPGEYRISQTLELDARDSGTVEGPVVYRAARPGSAILYGGQRLAGFTPVADPAILARLPEEARGRVMQCDLKALGIADYGEMRVRGFGQPPSPPTLELFFDGRPLRLARWPNQGFAGIRRLVDPGSAASGQPAVLEYDGDRPARWTQADDVWLFGYFRYLWADAAIKVAAIDTQARTLTTAEPYYYGGSMSAEQGIIYYAFNLLEELDQPGEWYLDRTTGVLYLYPPSDPERATIEIGMLSAPMVTLDQATDVRLEGLTFDLSRGHGLQVRDSCRCLIAGCTVSRMAGNGITLHGGEECGILGCDLHTIGRRATEVIGGDRERLIPGRHFVENCRIHGFGRIDRTYTPAIQLEGVGHRVAHNLMYDCPSSVMRIEGNDHLIEFNDVHSAVRESDDQGAMELFLNPTYRGVVFRYNRFRHVGKTGAEAAVHGQAAIRLDDAISGIEVYGNLFIRSANGHFGAVQMNSGRDNLIDNNLFVDCRQAVSGGWRLGNTVWKMLQEGREPADFYRGELYLRRYPRLAHLLEAPGINCLWRNICYCCGAFATGNPDYLELFANGVCAEEDPGFVDAAREDFRLRAGAPLWAQLGFRPIPIEEIGLYEDPFRASWPVHTTPVAMPDWRRSLGQ